MASLREEAPREFQNEERWYRFFTRTSLFVFLGGVFFTFVMSKLFGLFGIMPIGLIVGAILSLIVFGATVIKWPEDDPVHGGGQSIIYLVYKIYVAKKKGKIYIHGYKEGDK